MSRAEKKDAMETALRYLEHRARTEQEVRGRLADAEYEAAEIDECLQRLKDLQDQRIGTVDDPGVIAAVKADEKIVKYASGATVSTEAGTVTVTLDSTSTWTLTGDSYITEFNGDAGNIISNGCTLYVNGAALAGTN